MDNTALQRFAPNNLISMRKRILSSKQLTNKWSRHMNSNLFTSMKLDCYDAIGYPVTEKLQKTGSLANDHEHDPKMPTDYYTMYVYTFI